MEKLKGDILKNECTRLWKTVFGDSNEFIASFIESHYNEENMLYIEQHGKLLSMLHLIPFHLNGMCVAYIYAVATDSNTRGKGYATTLMQQAIEKAEKDGCKAVITLPADKGLVGFYSRFGFKGLYSVTFDTPDNFDFGTGNADNDFVTILPLDNSFAVPTEKDKIILKKQA